MEIFVAVADEEGFAAASRKMGISPPVVTRAVAELEQRLGIKLLTRTTRHVKVTDAGKRYLEDARKILEDVTIAEEAAAGINAEPSGYLSITAPVLFGRKYVLPSILEYLDKYPKTEVNAIFLDRVVNLLEEGMDVGIRIGELSDSSMRAIRIGSVRHVLCASPDYLKKHGIPQSPAELTNHSIIIAANVSSTATWRFSDELKVKVLPRLSLNSNDAAIQSAVNGTGITRLISYQVAPELEKGLLKTVLEEYEPPDIPVHIVHRETRQGSAKIRTFIDLLTDNLKENSCFQ